MGDELKVISPQSIEELVAGITPEVINTLKTAIELGKWQDGSSLGPEQLENCIQVLILYENKNVSEAERVGFNLSNSSKTPGCSQGGIKLSESVLEDSGETK